jgi:hypothetical protein
VPRKNNPGFSDPGCEQAAMIQSIEDFLAAIRQDWSSWHPQEPKWFRGEPDGPTGLVPTLYRYNLGSQENALLQMFRARAPAFHDAVPHRDHIDQWLFLARHSGLPTRLLDWSEGALIALHFALKEDQPIVWMLNPLDLNDLSYTTPSTGRPREFPLHWFEPPTVVTNPFAAPSRPTNPAFENLAGAWGEDKRGAQLPMAIYPTYVHSRLRSQRSCFTIHGKQKGSLSSMVPNTLLRRYVIDPSYCKAMRDELVTFGIAESVVFPDLNGLATELQKRFL